MSSLTPESIAHGFRSTRIQPVGVGILYRTGLVLVAMAMVLLPLVYLALVFATGWGVAWWARIAMDILAHRFSILTLLLVATPLLAGVAVLFFMFKPLLARPPKPSPPQVLIPGEHPLLEDFIKRVCHGVGSPVPRRIKVTTDVNAAAGPSGGLFSLVARRLDLTIGLPLASLPLQSFGGILAHEFGHFAQGGGMTLTYLIRSINHWFARVVYERDEWDDRLVIAAEQAGDWRLQLPLQVCRGAVWVSRRVLWVLMHVGSAISCFALRQMEYNADACEAGFAGSRQFGETCKGMAELNAGQEDAARITRTALQDKRLARSLPQLTSQRAGVLTDEERDMAFQRLMKRKSGFWDTHPCDSDRIRAAESLRLEGIFTCDQPAAGLFRNFDALCEEASIRFYRDQLGFDLKQVRLVENAGLVGEADELRAGEIAVVRFFHGRIDPSRPWTPIMPDFLRPAPALDEVESLKNQLEEAATNTYAGAFEAFDRVERRLFHLLRAKALLAAGFTLQPKEFGLVSATVPSADEAIESCRVELAGLTGSLEPFNHLAARTLQAGLRVAFEHDPSIRPEVERIIETSRQWVPVFPVLDCLREVVAVHGALCENSRAEVPGLLRAFERNSERATALKVQLVGIARDIPAAFSRPGGDGSLIATIREADAEARQTEAPPFVIPVIAAERIVNRIYPQSIRMLGRLAALAETPGPENAQRTL